MNQMTQAEMVSAKQMCDITGENLIGIQIRF